MAAKALTDEQIAEIEDRVVRGWVVRRDQLESLIAMARERNLLMVKAQAQMADPNVYVSGGATMTFVGTNSAHPWHVGGGSSTTSGSGGSGNI